MPALALALLAAPAAAQDTDPPGVKPNGLTYSGSSIRIAYDEEMDDGSRPAFDQFTVSLAGVSVSVGDLVFVDIVDGSTTTTTVHLGTGTEAAPGETISFSYAVPAANPLQDTSGNDAPAIATTNVPNNQAWSTTTVTAEAIFNSAVKLSYSEPLASTGAPASRFTVTAGGTARTVGGRNIVSRGTAGPPVVGATMILTGIDPPIKKGDTVTVSYSTALSATQKGRRDLVSSSTVMRAFTNLSVTNNAAELITSAVVVGNKVTLTYSGTLGTQTPANDRYAVTLGNVGVTATAVSVSGSTVTLTLDESAVYGESARIDYQIPSTNPLLDSDGKTIDRLSAYPVTNNTPAAVVWAEATGNGLTLTYQGPLCTTTVADVCTAHGVDASEFVVTVAGTARSVISANAHGSMVTLGLGGNAIGATDAVTVAYTKPSTQALQDGNGNEPDSFTARDVNNISRLLVRNSRQLDPGTNNLGLDYAQAFTTGSSAFKLTRLDLWLRDIASSPATAYTVSIHPSGSGGVPGASLGSLTTSDTTPKDRWLRHEFAASGTGIDLSADTTYFAVVDVTMGDNLNFIQYQVSNAEDAGAAPGWSLADKALSRGNDSTAWSANRTVDSLQIALHGHSTDMTAPALVPSADTPLAVNGNQLTLTYNENLDPGSVPAANRFSYTVAGGAATTPTAVRVSGKTVTLTLAAAVDPDQAVTVAYTQPPAAQNPLRDFAAPHFNLAPTFAAMTVTNITPRVVVPTVRIASNGNVSAGSPARFTVSASTAPSSNLDISLALAQTGGVLAPWSGTARIAASTTSVTFTTAATASGNSGTVTVTVQAGTGYQVHATAFSATATVTAQQGQDPPGQDPPDTGPQQARPRTPAVSGNTVTITFTKQIDVTRTAPPPAAFRVTVNGNPVQVTHVALGSVILTLAETVSADDRLTVQYDPSRAGGNPLYDLDGNLLNSFVARRGPSGGEQQTRDPQPLQLALWTDRAAYRAGQTVRLYYSLDPHDDRGRYRTFVYLERAGGGDRRWLAPAAAKGQLRPEAADLHGTPASAAAARLLAAADRELAFEGEPPGPGLWQFVLELQPGAADEQAAAPAAPLSTRRAWARFVVSERSLLLNRQGFDREVRGELTLRADTLYYLGHQLFVPSGATLAIEAGTVVQAFGPSAAIIVEPGGRIEAAGTRQAPVVLTCSVPAGQRWPGCWGGLRILGRAPVTRLAGTAPGVLPAERAAYGGADAQDSSGALRYVRVEFAGADPHDPAAAVPAIGLYGAGSGTQLEHVQAHASLGDGFAFRGGAAVCERCVASGSGAAGLSWERGWTGGASQLYVQHGREGGDGLAGGHDPEGHDREPRSLPTLSHVTLVHAAPYGRPARRAVALRLSDGSGVRAQRLLATGFGGGALRAIGRSRQLFNEGESALAAALLWLNGSPQVPAGLAEAANFAARNPQLRDVRDFANPDPRPKPDSPAVVDRGYIGAFDWGNNWLAGWTVFGPESVYDLRQRVEEDD